MKYSRKIKSLNYCALISQNLSLALQYKTRSQRFISEQSNYTTPKFLLKLRCMLPFTACTQVIIKPSRPWFVVDLFAIKFVCFLFNGSVIKKSKIVLKNYLAIFKNWSGWWSSGHRACLLFQQFEFNYHRVFIFLLKLELKRTNINKKRPEWGETFFPCTSSFDLFIYRSFMSPFNLFI